MMGRFAAWWQNHKPSKRRLIQVYCAVLFNCNFSGYAKGTVSKIDTKNVCVPGLNCYSCPGAVGACPLGSLQASLYAQNKSSLFYVVGILLLYGLLFGRTICGYFCPFGLIQELLYKIKTFKFRKNKLTRILSYLKYIIFIAFVILIPLLLSQPGFCKYICPDGTLIGGMLLINNPNNTNIISGLGFLFTWKTLLLFVCIFFAILMYRPFCRFICPLGALLGLFNGFSLLGVKVETENCTKCGLCVSKCKMDVKKVGDNECINCGACIPACPTGAIVWKGGKIFLHENEGKPVVKAKEAEIVKESVVNESTETASPVSTEKAAPKADHRKFRKGFTIGASCLAVALLAGTIVYSAVKGSSSAGSKISEGDVIDQKVKDITLSMYYEDGTFNVLDHKGTVTVINFWATWCTPCVEELPEFNEVQKDLGDEVYIVGVHSYDITDDVKTYMKIKGLSEGSMHYAQDGEKGETTSLLDAFGLQGAFPSTVILNKNSVVSAVYEQTLTAEELTSAIRKAEINY